MRADKPGEPQEGDRRPARRHTGLVELFREMGNGERNCMCKIQEKFQFSLSDAAKEVEKYWKS